MPFTMEEVKDFGNKALAKRSPGKLVLRCLLWLVALALTGLVAGVVAGALLGLTGNSFSFNLTASPENTLTYLIAAYLISYYQTLTKSQSCRLFIFALLLAFTVNLTQGLIWLLILPPVLKKLKLMA